MNMDNSFIIKLLLNGKDVTEQYSVINAKIYRACNKIDKATISISADIIDNSQFEIPDNKIFNPGTELKRVQQIRSTPYLRDALQPIS